MRKNTLFLLLTAAPLSVLAQAQAESNGEDVVAPATLHQEQTIERVEALEGNEPVQEAESVQEGAGHPVVPSPHQAEALEEIGMRFRRLDQNEDGQLSKAEAKAETDLAEQWAQLDHDGDGTLSLAEYRKRTIPSHQAR